MWKDFRGVILGFIFILTVVSFVLFIAFLFGNYQISAFTIILGVFSYLIFTSIVFALSSHFNIDEFCGR